MSNDFFEIYHKYHLSKDSFEERIYELCPFDYEKMWCDDYDSSIEFGGVVPDVRLNEAVCQFLFENGFSRCYVNHSDKWETHYHKLPKCEEWRVSYLNKFGGTGILVEEIPKSWSFNPLVGKGITIVPKPVYEK